MTIGIVGSRRRYSARDYNKVHKAFKAIYSPGDEIVSGGCPTGADNFAEYLAEGYSIPIHIHFPDESKLDKTLLKTNPRAAYTKINYARNTLVARDSTKALIACVASDRKGGTEDTIKKYRKFYPNGMLILV